MERKINRRYTGMINFCKTRVSSHEGKKRDAEESGRAVKSEVMGEKQGRKAKGRIMKSARWVRALDISPQAGVRNNLN
jgi:hypothetical protein